MWGGDQLRDFNFIDDVVDALLRAAVTPSCLGMALNLGGDEPLKLRDVAELLVSANGGGTYEVKDFPADRRAIEIGDYYTDFSKAREVLGWSPRISFRDGLTRTLAFFRENLEHYT